jgi:GPI mannosyltransferase 1 subunit M
MNLTTQKLFSLAFIARLLLIVFGEFQDGLAEEYFHGVRYTDIDYEVFTEAARFMTKGESPYSEQTYRYTPMLAFVLQPNIFLFKSFGKVLFSVFDMYSARIVLEILRKRKCDRKFIKRMISLYLFNPLTVAISTRGSCDSVANVLVLLAVRGLLFGTILSSAICFGVAVHFRMYPIIYVVPLIKVLDVHYHLNWNHYGSNNCEGGSASSSSSTGIENSNHNNNNSSSKMAERRRGRGEVDNEQKISNTEETKKMRQLQRARALASKSIFSANGLFNIARVLFAMISFTTFALATYFCYWKYGREYLDVAILYHFSRKDPRHNFAPNFLSVYLDTALDESNYKALIFSKLLTKMYAFASKITQYGLTIYIGHTFAYDLPFAMFAQTFAFVAFNSVITAQYFAWWCALLPISLATSNYASRNSNLRLTSAFVTWIISKLLWLKNAHALEMLGEANGHFSTWAASCGFLVSSANLLSAIFMEQKPKRVFVRGRFASLQKFK